MSAQYPIIQYWHSHEPPDYVSRFTRSFAELNPARPHLLYNAKTAADFIGEHFTQRELAAFRVCGPPAMQADYFRCCAILHYAGIWSDAGFICVRNLDALVEDAEDGQLFLWPAPSAAPVLMNGFFAFSVPQHPFLELVLDVSTALIGMRWQGLVREVTGPLVMTVIFRLYRAGSVNALMAELHDELGDGNRHIRYARTVCQLIGGFDRAQEACARIRVSSPECCTKWVRVSNEGLPHRRSIGYWPRIGSDIYVSG